MQRKARGADLTNLTQGDILSKLLLVALPIMGSQIIQMTYNLTDMFWLGRLSSGAVAASGTVGMYLWLSMAFITFGSKGAEIGVSQNVGGGDRPKAQAMAQTAVTLNLILGIGFGLVLFLFRGTWVRLLNVTDPGVYADAVGYLAVVSIGVPFSFVTGALISTFTGSGNARTPFFANGISLVCNMLLDPLLIFTFGMGIYGAAVATVIAQVLACLLLAGALLWQKGRPFERFRLFAKMQGQHLRQILRWATPIAAEAFLFTLLTMMVTRMINRFGTDAMSASRVGSQIESLSWLIAGGYASALTAFVGQNYGGRKWGRIHRGFTLSSFAMLVWGLVVTGVLFFGGTFIYQIFLPGDAAVAEIGGRYMRILAVCQLFQCIEGIASGSFRGMGMTVYPSIVSFVCNAFRVVLAYFLSQTSLGLYGIFWAVTIGASLRGIWMYLWYVQKARRLPQVDEGAGSALEA